MGTHSNTPAATSETTPTAQSTSYQFHFHGNASEFFKIWIVNLAFTIVTLGIYSAWAKVRTNRYFYGNTKVAGHTFSYLAKPIPILIGRLVLMGILIIAAIFDYFYPGAQFGIFGLLFMLMPLFVVRSLAFRLRNTAYRTVRFGFVGTVKRAYFVYVLGCLATVATFGIAYPVFKKYATHFAINHSRFGQLPFTTSAIASQFYALYTIAIVLSVCCVALLFGLFFVYDVISSSMVSPIAYGIAFILTYGIAFIVAGSYILGKQFNLMMNTTTLDETASHKLVSTMPISGYIWVMASNTLLMLCTLGLLYPWAKVRLAKYRATYCSLVLHGGIDNVVAQEQHTTSALGEEIGDYMDIDIGF